ncbi:MAG: hypothetical protein U9Q77_11195 [Candidatus Marinimicrobia bacterium]|nr:hypothetical protein [Candidatus Neomarinimicrobiota bacterium]
MFNMVNYSTSRRIRKLLLSFGLPALGILFSLTACTSTPHLLEPPRVTFNEQIRATDISYIGTLEGCIVGRKDKPVKKLKIDANMEEFLNISSQGGKTDQQGFYKIDLYWKNRPYLLADVYPDPAQNSFTASGLSYLKAARTVSLDIPIIMGKQRQILTTQALTLYSLNYVLKRIAEEVVNPRVRTISYTVEDYNTGFPIVGASVTVTASSSILPVDSLLAAYIKQPDLRELASSSVIHFIDQADTQVQEPKGVMAFSVMSYADYRLTVTHPDFHTADEKLYVEMDLDKIVRLTAKDQKRWIDIIDR